MRAKVLDECGRAPNYVITDMTLWHQPTGLSAPIDDPKNRDTIGRAYRELNSAVRHHQFELKAKP